MGPITKDLPSLPTELWRCIFRWCTFESACPDFSQSFVSFGWPYNPTLDASFFRSLATKRSLVLVSRQFSQIASEFFFETLHFRTARQTIELAEQCRTNLKIVGFLRFCTKNLYITPVFDFVTTEEEQEKIVDFLRSMLEITKMCGQLRNVLVQADSVTLFHEPTYKSWVEILAALPSQLCHLAIENFLLGPVVWKPRLFSTWNPNSNLRTLRLDAEHPPFEHNFTSLTHLWLFSWPTASKWNMPSLTNLYIEYFPGNESTSSFWTEVRPKLKLLHFGGDTDFGLYLPDLPQRLQDCTPNLQELEYHCSGDLDIVWDPSRLSQALMHVTIRLEDAEGHGLSSSLTPQDVMLRYTSAGFAILLELLTDLCPSAADRWVRIERHLEKYSSHPAKLFVLLPRRAASLLQLYDPPPLLCSSRT